MPVTDHDVIGGSDLSKVKISRNLEVEWRGIRQADRALQIDQRAVLSIEGSALRQRKALGIKFEGKRLGSLECVLQNGCLNGLNGSLCRKTVLVL